MPIQPKKKIGIPKKVSALSAAQEAVRVYEEEVERLQEMKQEFKDQFPDADAFLQDIMRQEDLVQDKIKIAIPLIREAKQDVGDFKCQLKRSTPNYDPDQFMKLAMEIEEGGEIIMELIEQGYIKKLVLDPSVTNYFVNHPDAADHFSDAWRDAQDLTPAITAPKL